MSFIDAFLHLLAPHDCLGCRAEGALLCEHCKLRLPDPQPECYFCHQPMPDYLSCADCYKRAGLRQVVVGTLYDGIAKQLVRRLKFGGTQAAAALMISMLPPLGLSNAELLIVPVPTATARARRRGYDQAELLGRCLSRRQRHAYLPCLRRLGGAHQVGASRVARLQQLAGAFVVAQPSRIRGKYVLLIDDVITTGATFEAAASALYLAGALQVSAVAFARPEFDATIG